jgi:hypothetical protein
MHAESELLPGDSVRAVESMAEAFDARSIRYALIGGLALAVRGRPRFTRDVDILLEVPQVALPGLLSELQTRGFTLEPQVVIEQFVREHLRSFTLGPVRINWLKPVLPLYSRTLADAETLEWTEGHTVRVASSLRI